MALDRINGSPLPRPGGFDSTRQGERVGNDGKPVDTLAGVTPAAGKATGGDTAEISDAAHRLMELRMAVDRGRTALSGLPDTRAEKMAAARERLLSGFYNSDEVREQTAAGAAEAINALANL